MSLLREIQNDLASPGGDVTSVLRKCKILAARLGSHEFARWVDWELNGYPESQAAPLYRHLGVSCYANFMNIAWQANRQAVPLALIPEEFRDALDHVEYREGIAAVTRFVSSGATINKPELGFLLEGKMYPDMHCVGAWAQISGSAFEQLVSAVKNRILDFVLEIEAENPDAGDAPLNSHPVPMERLQPLVNNFFGAVENLAQNSQGFNQTANLGIQHQDLTRLLAEFNSHLGELRLDPRERQRAEAQIATLETEMAGEPNPAIVRQAGRTLRNITEGAIAGLITTAVQPSVWLWIHQMLAGF